MTRYGIDRLLGRAPAHEGLVVVVSHSRLGPVRVPAEQLGGVWALHRLVGGDGPGDVYAEEGWTITHAPSGLLACTFATRQIAEAAFADLVDRFPAFERDLTMEAGRAWPISGRPQDEPLREWKRHWLEREDSWCGEDDQ